METVLHLRHIEVFYTVFRCGSISAAARELNVSQPSISKVLRHAEDRLGYRLFERRKGGLQPTPAAHELFGKCEDVYGHIQSLNHIARSIGARKSGHICIGVLPSLGLSVIPKAIAAFHALNPEVTFEVDTMHSREVGAALLDRRCDVAIGFGTPPNERLKSVCVGKGELYVAALKGALPISGGKFEIANLDGYPFVGLRDSGPSGDLLLQVLNSNGVEPTEVAVARTHYVALALARLKLGATVIDSFTADCMKDDTLDVCSFADPVIYPVNALFSEDLCDTVLLSSFLDKVRDALVLSEDAVKDGEVMAVATGGLRQY